MRKIVPDEKIVTTYERRSYAGVEGKNGYGYVWVKVGEEDFEPVYEPRKVTASLRVAIILDYIYDHNGEQATVKFFAKALGVCDYTIQKTLHLLEQIGCIEIVPTKSKELGQTANIYYYFFGIYTAEKKAGVNPTIEKLYSVDNPFGFRDWHWVDYKTIVGRCDDWHTMLDKIEQYSELRKKIANNKRKKSWNHKKTISYQIDNEGMIIMSFEDATSDMRKKYKVI